MSHPARVIPLPTPAHAARPSRDWPVADFIDWRLRVAALDLAPRTVRNMDVMLRRPILAPLTSLPLGDVKPADVHGMLATLTAVYSRGSVKTIRMMLSGVFRSAVELGVIDSNPVTGAPMAWPRPAEYTPLTPAEMMRLARVILDGPPSPSNAVILGMLGCGLRICEARGPQPADLVLRGSPVWRVERQAAPYGAEWRPPKSDQGRRAVPMLDEVAEAIEAHWSRFGRAPAGQEWATGYTVARPVSLTKVTRDLGRHCKSAGVAVVNPHGLRHAWATAHAEAGMSAARLARMLGTTVEVALTYYVHVVDGDGWEIANRTFAQARTV